MLHSLNRLDGRYDIDFGAIARGQNGMEDWRTEARKKAEVAAAARDPGYYWIKRCEPDGESDWEPAQFVKYRDGQTGWYILGTNGHLRTEVHAPFSNAWQIGERIKR